MSVLLVDGDVRVRRAIARLFSRYGVRHYPSIPAALSHMNRCDVLLCDAELPASVLASIDVHCQSRIVMVTSDPSRRHRARSLGLLVVEKTFGPKRLAELVDLLLQGRLVAARNLVRHASSMTPSMLRSA